MAEFVPPAEEFWHPISSRAEALLKRYATVAGPGRAVLFVYAAAHCNMARHVAAICRPPLTPRLPVRHRPPASSWTADLMTAANLADVQITATRANPPRRAFITMSLDTRTLEASSDIVTLILAGVVDWLGGGMRQQKSRKSFTSAKRSLGA